MEEGVNIIHLIQLAIKDGLTLEIDYVKNNYERSTRVISDISTCTEYGAGYISAYCHTKEEGRTFKISRIADARIVPDPGKITVKQLANSVFDINKPIFSLYGEEY